MNQKYLITLTGQGDTHFIVIDKDVWDWMHSNKDWQVPEHIRQKYFEIDSKYGTPQREMEECVMDTEDMLRYDIENGLISNLENDKALFLESCYNISNSVRELIDYVRENDIEIVGEWEGYIY